MTERDDAEDTVSLQIEYGIAKLRLNRPGIMNAVNQRMHDALRESLDFLESRHDLGAIIITGQGSAFCAGQDLSERNAMLADGEIDLSASLEHNYNPLIRRLTMLPCPVIAAVNGVASGAGAALAIACDIVIAAHSARFQFAFSRVGLGPDCGTSYNLPRLVGSARAMALTLTGQSIDARTAESYGMIWKSVPDDELESAALKMAEDFCRGPRQALAAIKMQLRQPENRTLDECLESERLAQNKLGRSDDYREAVSAFSEKRAPRFHTSISSFRTRTLLIITKDIKLMSECISLASYTENHWQPSGGGNVLLSAVDGRAVASMPSMRPDIGAMLHHARTAGGPALRSMTFRQRGLLVRALAEALTARKEELYEISYDTGATQPDSAFDIEGGIGALYVYASKARALPDGHVLADGDREPLAKGDFAGQHIYTSRRGVGIHINAYNFPVWGMLEKLAPALIAGLPIIVKPATTGAFLAHAAFRIMVDSGLLPTGAAQLLLGDTGDLLDLLNDQDVLSFTGSAQTAAKLRTHPAILREGVRFTAEQDSLNACILGLDVTPDKPEFELFVKEVVREMTQKAGQKCTAIRRILVPQDLTEAVESAIASRLSRLPIGNPRSEGVRVGALAGLAQRDDVQSKLEMLKTETRIVAGADDINLVDASASRGAFFAPTLLRCDSPATAKIVHAVEAFGPVSTLMAYQDTAQAAAIARLGRGSLVLSLFSHKQDIVEEIFLNCASSHGRVLLVDRNSAAFSTGHGAAMPQLIHGGPGRAGGGEELGGVIAIKHNMQRTAIQGTTATLDALAAL